MEGGKERKGKERKEGCQIRSRETGSFTSSLLASCPAPFPPASPGATYLPTTVLLQYIVRFPRYSQSVPRRRRRRRPQQKEKKVLSPDL